MPPVMPIDLEDVVWSVMMGLIMLIPVIGITARFALKPVVEAIARMRESQSSTQAVQMLERRMDLLEQEVHSIAGLREDIARLVEAQDFHMRLGLPDQTKEKAPVE